MSTKFSALLRELAETIEHTGESKVIIGLRQLRYDINIEKEIENIISDIICKYYSITNDELLSSRGRDASMQAHFIYCYLLKKYTNLTHRNIADKVNKHFSMISRYIKTIKNLKPTLVTDKIIYDNLVQCENKLRKILLK